MDKLHYILLGVIVILLVAVFWSSRGNGEVATGSNDAAKLRAWQDCALKFHEDLADIDQGTGDPDYYKLYGNTTKLMNNRVACENAVQQKYR